MYLDFNLKCKYEMVGRVLNSSEDKDGINAMASK